MNEREVKELRRELVALKRDTDQSGENVVILSSTFTSVFNRLIDLLEAEENRLGIDPNSPEWFRQHRYFLTHPDRECGNCRRLYSEHGGDLRCP